jgi:hypothetical protein
MDYSDKQLIERLARMLAATIYAAVTECTPERAASIVARVSALTADKE